MGGVGDADGMNDVVHDGADGGVGVALDGLVGKVAAQTLRRDDGAVQAGSAHEGGGTGDQAGAGNGHETGEDDGDLTNNKTSSAWGQHNDPTVTLNAYPLSTISI